MAGITSAVKMVEQYGRGPDTMLAHISPDEAALIDHLQGGRRINPTTGLAEYGLFGKILKGVARAAAGIGGFMVGGPAGAAAATAAATKLTGGSWKDAAVGGALGGLGAGLGNMAAGTGFMGTTGLAGAAANSVPLSQLGTVASQTVLPTGLAGSLGSMTSGIGGLGGLGAGIGGLMAGPREQAQPMDMTPPVPDANITYNPGAAPTREYVGFEGDYTKYGERGGEHQFYRPRSINVPGLSMTDEHPSRDLLEMAKGGGVRRASMRGMSQAARMGRIHGPGDGQSDDIPARLSQNEHVIDAGTVALAGNGSSDAGHRVIEKFKRDIRAKAGLKKPSVPPKRVRVSHG